MKQDRPSLTAYKVAMMRAAHQVLDTPKIFEVDYPATGMKASATECGKNLYTRLFDLRSHGL